MDLETNDLITDKQAFQIKQQLLAYKHLIRNMNIPTDLEKDIFNLSKE